MILVDADHTASAPFKIPADEEWTFLATGLGGTDKVTFEIIALTAAGPGGDTCCPGPVSMPNIAWRTPLKTVCGCDPAANVELTAAMPYVVLSRPREVMLLVTVNAAPHAIVEVHSYVTSKHAHGSGCCC